MSSSTRIIPTGLLGTMVVTRSFSSLITNDVRLWELNSCLV